MKSKFGAGRDFEVTDLDGNKAFFVDGKIGPRPKAEVRDAQDAVVYHVTGKFLGIPKRMVISNASGQDVAQLSAKAFSFIKDKMNLEVMDGPAWALEGSFIEKNYTVTSEGRTVVQITQKWVAIRDQYRSEPGESLGARTGHYCWPRDPRRAGRRPCSPAGIPTPTPG